MAKTQSRLLLSSNSTLFRIYKIAWIHIHAFNHVSLKVVAIESVIRCVLTMVVLFC